MGEAGTKVADGEAAGANVSLWQALRAGRLTGLGLEDLAQAFGLLAAITPILSFPFLLGLTNQDASLLPSILSIEDIVVFSLQIYVFLIAIPSLIAWLLVLSPLPLRWSRRAAGVVAAAVALASLLNAIEVVNIPLFDDPILDQFLVIIAFATLVGLLLFRFDRVLGAMTFLPEFLRRFLRGRIRPALFLLLLTWVLYLIPFRLGQLVGQGLELRRDTTLVLSGATCGSPRLIFNGTKASIYFCAQEKTRRYVIYFPEERASMITTGIEDRASPLAAEKTRANRTAAPNALPAVSTPVRPAPAPARPTPATPAPAPGRSS